MKLHIFWIKMGLRTFLFMGMILILGVMLTGQCIAETKFFDFEDGTGTVGPLSGLNAYMDSHFGSNVNVSSNVQWVGEESSLFNSDILFANSTAGSSGQIDFDPAASSATSFRITKLSFDWGVFNSSTGRDFGLDVYDDVTEGWHTNIFQIAGDVGPQTGFSGVIDLDPTWQITRIRFHDNTAHDVGIDNLTIISQVPEPSTILLLGAGLLGFGVFRRKRS